MLETILELDTELLLFFNGFHSSWMDPIMMVATKTLTWLPLYLVLIYLIIKFKRWDAIYILLGVAMAVTLADQITSTFMKPFFARLRPSQEESLIDVLHLVNNYRGGLYGFASSHAANTFGVATFIYLLFRARYPWITAIFLWAAFVSYTRIYLGVHYPGDILVGAMVGILSGLAGFAFANFLLKEVQKRKTTAP